MNIGVLCDPNTGALERLDQGSKIHVARRLDRDRCGFEPALGFHGVDPERLGEQNRGPRILDLMRACQTKLCNPIRPNARLKDH